MLSLLSGGTTFMDLRSFMFHVLERQRTDMRPETWSPLKVCGRLRQFGKPRPTAHQNSHAAANGYSRCSRPPIRIETAVAPSQRRRQNNRFCKVRFPAVMSSNPNQARKPFDAAPYASLRTSDAPQHEPAASADAELLSEGERLRALREALWSAFQSAPSSALPNVLIDLSMAYTSSLRLQLSMKGWSTRQSAPKAKVAAAARATAPDKG